MSYNSFPYYSALPPLIPGDLEVNGINIFDNMQIRGVLRVSDNYLYPTTIPTVGKIVTPILEATSAVIPYLSTGTTPGSGTITTGVIQATTGFINITVGTSATFINLSATSATFTNVSIGTLGVTGRVGLFGATPTTQFTPIFSSTASPTAGATTNVFVNTGFTGDVGSTTYTVGDVIRSLKLLGVLTS